MCTYKQLTSRSASLSLLRHTDRHTNNLPQGLLACPCCDIQTDIQTTDLKVCQLVPAATYRQTYKQLTSRSTSLSLLRSTDIHTYRRTTNLKVCQPEAHIRCDGCRIAQFTVFRTFPHNLLFSAHFRTFCNFLHISA